MRTEIPVRIVDTLIRISLACTNNSSSQISVTINIRMKLLGRPNITSLLRDTNKQQNINILCQIGNIIVLANCILPEFMCSDTLAINPNSHNSEQSNNINVIINAVIF